MKQSLRYQSLWYFVALLLALSSIFGYPGTILALLLILMISISTSIEVKKSAEEKDISKERIEELKTSVDAVSRQVNELQINSQKSVSNLETRIDEVKTDYRLELESQYRDLARKIIEVENHLMEIRKTVGAAFGSLEDRLESR